MWRTLTVYLSIDSVYFVGMFECLRVKKTEL